MEKPHKPISEVNNISLKDRKDKVLELALDALRWTDEAIREFALLESPFETIACQPGCHYCCFNQPMVTPPEVLLIGHQVEQAFTKQERQELSRRIERVLELTNGKTPDEIVEMRYELPCIFLTEEMCSVYEARPAVCRTCSSADPERCKMVFECRDPTARLRCHPHMRQIFQAVHTGLLARCREMGCQSDALWIAAAIKDYFNHPRPTEAWIEGEMIFHLARED